MAIVSNRKKPMITLKNTDPTTYTLLKQEDKRQKETLQLIPSENYTSKAVREALASTLTNKYSEGYPKKRYYQGNENADHVEELAIQRACRLFDVPHTNVQALSGSPANTAVYFALLKPLKDTIMGLSLSFGGHLTHGASVSLSGKYFKSVLYELDEKGQLDYNQIARLAKKHKPKIIVAGTTAFPRKLDFKKFAEIADSVDAYLHADISHIAGLVVGKQHQSPVPYAHTVMTTTHKTLRGPRGALIMTTKKGLAKNPDLGKMIDKAVFPGLQGGPHDNQTAAIAVALYEASQKNFKKYSEQIVANAKTLAQKLNEYDFDLVSGGTDNHLMLIDFTNKKTNGALVAYALEKAGIITNKNSVPNDPMPPFYPSGLRIGTPAITSRGMKEKEMKKIAKWIHATVEIVRDNPLPKDKEERRIFFKNFKETVNENSGIKAIKKEVTTFAKTFPIR